MVITRRAVFPFASVWTLVFDRSIAAFPLGPFACLILASVLKDAGKVFASAFCMVADTGTFFGNCTITTFFLDVPTNFNIVARHALASIFKRLE